MSGDSCASNEGVDTKWARDRGRDLEDANYRIGQVEELIGVASDILLNPGVAGERSTQEALSVHIERVHAVLTATAILLREARADLDA